MSSFVLLPSATLNSNPTLYRTLSSALSAENMLKCTASKYQYAWINLDKFGSNPQIFITQNAVSAGNVLSTDLDIFLGVKSVISHF
jgi:hypothetical protein